MSRALLRGWAKDLQMDGVAPVEDLIASRCEIVLVNMSFGFWVVYPIPYSLITNPLATPLPGRPSLCAS